MKQRRHYYRPKFNYGVALLILLAILFALAVTHLTGWYWPNSTQ
jgi:hypothetical protein